MIKFKYLFFVKLQVTAKIQCNVHWCVHIWKYLYSPHVHISKLYIVLHCIISYYKTVYFSLKLRHKKIKTKKIDGHHCYIVILYIHIIHNLFAVGSFLSHIRSTAFMINSIHFRFFRHFWFPVIFDFPQFLLSHLFLFPAISCFPPFPVSRHFLFPAILNSFILNVYLLSSLDRSADRSLVSDHPSLLLLCLDRMLGRRSTWPKLPSRDRLCRSHVQNTSSLCTFLKY